VIYRVVVDNVDELICKKISCADCMFQMKAGCGECVLDFPIFHIIEIC
jgi:hypothetical protein